MKGFLQRTALFFIPLVLLLLVLDGYLRNMNTLYSEKYHALHDHAREIEVVITGNSHATYGVDPAQFDLRACNVANVNQSLYFDRRIVAKALDKLVNLRYVLISVDYHSLWFSSQGDQRDIWSYYGHGIRYRDKNMLSAVISPFIFGYTPRVAKAMMSRAWKRYRQQQRDGRPVLNFDVEGGVDVHDTIYHGFISFTGVAKSEFSTQCVKERVAVFSDIINTSNEHQAIISDLAGFIADLQSRGITPVLFAAPCHPLFNARLDEAVIKRNRVVMDSLCENYGVEFWDYTQQEMPEGMFFNSDHLNSKGASLFGDILNERLKGN